MIPWVSCPVWTLTRTRSNNAALVLVGWIIGRKFPMCFAYGKPHQLPPTLYAVLPTLHAVLATLYAALTTLFMRIRIFRFAFALGLNGLLASNGRTPFGTPILRSLYSLSRFELRLETELFPPLSTLVVVCPYAVNYTSLRTMLCRQPSSPLKYGRLMATFVLVALLVYWFN